MPATVTCNLAGKGPLVAAVMIGVDPHKGSSHTAVAIGADEEPLGQVRVRASAAQAERLLAWAASWPQRIWAVEGAGGLGHLLAQQLAAAGERVLDVPPTLGARVRLLAAGDVNKNDPDDARSAAVAALRSAGVREARPDDHAAVLKIWSKRHRDLGRTRTQVACRLHAVLCELVPGGVSRHITAAQAANILGSITPPDAVAAARFEALRALKRQVSDAVFARLRADAQRAAARAKDPGGQQGNDSATSAAGSHPRRRLTPQAPALRASHSRVPPPPYDHDHQPGARQPRGTRHTWAFPGSRHPPPAKPQVQVERPQRSEDERPSGAARRRPYSATRKATSQPLDAKRHSFGLARASSTTVS